jgi:hypothetical protein
LHLVLDCLGERGLLGRGIEPIGEQGFGIVPAGKIATAIYTEQLGAVFRQMPIALTVNLVNGALTAIILSSLAAGSPRRSGFLPWSW